METTVSETTELGKPTLTIPVETKENRNNNSPYENSSAANKLRERNRNSLPLRIAFLDIDSTITGTSDDETNAVRKQLEALGYAIVYVTSRTEEMVMSKEQQDQSPDFERPPAKLDKTHTGKYQTIDPAKKIPEGLIDPDIIAGSTGTAIWVKQNEGGYRQDEQFLRTKIRADSLTWQQAALGFVDYTNLEQLRRNLPILCQTKAINNPDKYIAGDVDVFPPDFRVQVDFPAIQDKVTFADELRKLHTDSLYRLAYKNYLLSQGLSGAESDKQLEESMNIKLTDDSDPKKAVPSYSAYLSPQQGYKTRAVEQVVDMLSHTLNVPRNKLELLLAGDSFPDLGMGLYGGLGTKATFIIVGNSRLSDALLASAQNAKETSDQSQTNTTSFDQRSYPVTEYVKEGISAIGRRMRNIGDGIFEFAIPLPPVGNKRTIIIGDARYPGLKGPQTILKVLSEKE